MDARLRDEMRTEIINLQRSLGITTVYVTHDQTEALSMSDRIAVFNQGVCQQVGTPMEVTTRPTNSFVAAFVGETNLLPYALPERHPGDSDRLLRRLGSHRRQPPGKRRFPSARSRREIAVRLHPSGGNSLDP